MKKPVVFLFLIINLSWLGCSVPTGMFEKDIALPGQQWAGSFHPTVDFRIQDSDTAYRYNVYLVLRHTDAYNYNNIWIRGTVRTPGDTAMRSERYDLQLATNDKGWIGTAMDDIYDARLLVQPKTKFRKSGIYHITMEQLMREDPLKNVLSAGLRVERTTE